MMLNWNSFRLRIAVLSASLAGGALIGFGLVSWWLIRDARIQQLDARLNEQVVRAIAVAYRPEHRRPDRFGEPGPPSQGSPNAFHPDQAQWQQLFEDFIRSGLAVNSSVPVGILVTDPQDQVLYQSDAWPADLRPDTLWVGVEESQFFRIFRRSNFPPIGGPIPSNAAPPPPLEAIRTPPHASLSTPRTAAGLWRMGRMVTPDGKVAIAVSFQTIDQDMAVIRSLFLITIPAVLALIAVGAWLLSGSTLRPIHRLTHSIQKVTVQGLNQRVPSDRTDVEFIELIDVFNQMLERLERSFHQALRFSGDAAHELKTPLAILQGELEQAIQHLEDSSPLQQTLSELLDEVRRLSSIVRKLLLLSLADAGQMRLHYVELDLAEILQELLDDIGLLAPDLHVETEIAPSLKLWGDRDLLTQVLQNLISNAIKYNLPEGWIHILAQQQGSSIQVTIRNASVGIEEGDRDRIFDRFYRGDPSRNRKVEGVGLGLSLSREIVRTHGGSLVLDATSPDETSFTLKLPLSSQELGVAE